MLMTTARTGLPGPPRICPRPPRPAGAQRPAPAVGGGGRDRRACPCSSRRDRANTAPADVFIVVAIAATLLWAGSTRQRLKFPYVVGVGTMVVAGCVAALFGKYPHEGASPSSSTSSCSPGPPRVANVGRTDAAAGFLVRAWCVTGSIWSVWPAGVRRPPRCRLRYRDRRRGPGELHPRRAERRRLLLRRDHPDDPGRAAGPGGCGAGAGPRLPAPRHPAHGIARGDHRAAGRAGARPRRPHRRPAAAGRRRWCCSSSSRSWRRAVSEVMHRYQVVDRRRRAARTSCCGTPSAGPSRASGSAR